MTAFFSKKPAKLAQRSADFSFISDSTHYFDSACQTLRPQAVLDAEQAYYTQYNACGHRVKYPWGEKVDQAVMQTRKDMVTFIGKPYSTYETCFTLNTTYGINLVLSQLPVEGLKRVVISEIEHNSVYLPSIAFAKKHQLEHVVLKRDEQGSLIYKPTDLDHALVILNTTSNIDGRHLTNASDIARDAHAQGGLFLVDAAQTVGHKPESLREVDADAIFASGHKMYAPSLGIIVIKRSLLARLQPNFIGGGMVTDVREHDFDLITDEKELFSRLEPGLQSWAGIIGLHANLSWLKKQDFAQEHQLAAYLRQKLEAIDGLHLVSPKESSTQSVYSDKIDAHQLALAMGQAGIMARSGYFCCHYYLKHVKQLPPLLRISLGLHNTKQDVDALTNALTIILKRF